MALTPVYGIGGWLPDEPGENIVGWEEAPAPAPAPADPLVVIAAIGDALATITPTSTSTQLRSALLAARTAIDTAIQGA